MLLLIGLLVFLLPFSAESIDIEALMKRMTIEDKCGQMTQVTFEVFEKRPQPTDPSEIPIDLDKLMVALRNYRLGSLQNTPYNYAAQKDTWQKIIRLIQDIALNDTALKIPILYGIDSIHGANYIREGTLFPQPLSLAATFNVDFAYKVGEITALETRAVGIPWNFNPVLDVGRQLLWSRLFETFGEDAYLTRTLGEYYVKGHQGDSLKDRSKAATCLKHYIGYSNAFNGRDRSNAFIPEDTLREYYLPPFAKAVSAGAPCVMLNSGFVNGIPGHANKHYITDILKGELGFDGFVISDWEDVVRLHTRDKMAETPEDAVRIAVMAGLDISMVPLDYSFFDHCVNLTRKDAAFARRVDDANRRILRVKDRLGLFENPYPVEADLDKIGTSQSEAVNLEAARESVILAKNEKEILPLKNTSRILVTGPTSNLLRVLNGGWSYTWQGNDESTFQNYGRKKYTVLEAISRINQQTEFVESVNFTHVIDIEKAVESSQNSDVILLCLGEDTYTETPGNLGSLLLSEPQIKLAESLMVLNKTIVVVYIGGRPRVMTEIVNGVDAVVLAFLPGNRGGEAIADVLFGRVNPSGRLPITYPLNTNGITTYDYLPIELFDLNKYDNLFPFGHGLSYTTFVYYDLTLSTSELVAPNHLIVHFTVYNSGKSDGKETVLLYLNDVYGSIPRPMRQLKKFEKIFLASGSFQTVTFTLTMEDLSFINSDNRRIYEDGLFNVYVGNLSSSFVLKGSPKNNSNRITSFHYIICHIIFFVFLFMA